MAYHHSLKPRSTPSSSRTTNTEARPATQSALSRRTCRHDRSRVSPPATMQTSTAKKPSNPDCFSDIAQPATTPLTNNHHGLSVAEQVRARRRDAH